MTEQLTKMDQKIELQTGRPSGGVVAVIVLAILVLAVAAVFVARGNPSGVTTGSTQVEPHLVDPYWLHNRDRTIEPEGALENSPYLSEASYFQAREYENRDTAIEPEDALENSPYLSEASYFLAREYEVEQARQAASDAALERYHMEHGQ